MFPRRLSPRHALLPLALLFALPLIAAGSCAAAAGNDDMDMKGMDMSGMHAGAKPGEHHDQTTIYSFGQPYNGGPAARTVEIIMEDASFTPAHVEVKTGEAVRFVVTNTSGIDHDFTLGDTATQSAHRKEMAEAIQAGREAQRHQDGNAVTVQPGASKVLSWRFTKPGSFEYDCNMPGHFEAGMRGVITVSR
jgi:uncharacterized cupredoxin-like copper-binding protein